jgi:hypothetical protein
MSKEAKATFRYVVNNQSGEVSVGAKSAVAKSEDDWKISLALQAGQDVAEQFNTGIRVIQLSLKSFETR